MGCIIKVCSPKKILGLAKFSPLAWTIIIIEIMYLCSVQIIENDKSLDIRVAVEVMISSRLNNIVGRDAESREKQRKTAKNSEKELKIGENR
jgi:hypothetical protein